MEPIIISDLAITKQEMVRIAYYSHIKKRSTLYIITSIVFMALMYDMMEERGRPELALMALLLPIYFFIAPWFTYKRFYDHPFNKRLFQSSTITFQKDKILIKDKDGSYGEIVATAIVHVDIIKEYYRLFVAANQSINIPQRAFTNEEDHQRFRELFNFNTK